MSLASASGLPRYLAATSRHAGPSFFFSTERHLKQLLWRASPRAAASSAACALPRDASSKVPAIRMALESCVAVFTGLSFQTRSAVSGRQSSGAVKTPEYVVSTCVNPVAALLAFGYFYAAVISIDIRACP